MAKINKNEEEKKRKRLELRISSLRSILKKNQRKLLPLDKTTHRMYLKELWPI
jgi:hypothetical protein